MNCVTHDGPLDHVLYADDTATEYRNRKDILRQLQVYNGEATKENFQIKWQKVSIITGKT